MVANIIYPDSSHMIFYVDGAEEPDKGVRIIDSEFTNLFNAMIMIFNSTLYIQGSHFSGLTVDRGCFITVYANEGPFASLTLIQTTIT